MKIATVVICGISIIIAGLVVISSTNPVHGILGLVLAFVGSSILIIMEGVDFLGLMLMIVYVGAIAILFLFVVMMLNIRLVELIDNATRYVPIGLMIGLVLLGELMLVYDKQNIKRNENWQNKIWTESIDSWSSIKAMGNYLYTEGWAYFLVSGVILLIAMIGAIVLTLHHSKDVKRQDIYGQVVSKIDETIVLYK